MNDLMDYPEIIKVCSSFFTYGTHRTYRTHKSHEKDFL
jgi:hypothetical protein